MNIFLLLPKIADWNVEKYWRPQSESHAPPTPTPTTVSASAGENRAAAGRVGRRRSPAQMQET